MKKILTLALVVKERSILLGMKKRGFGVGQWNGFGGKVEEGESVEAAACREIEEEVGITAVKLEAAGILNFTFAEDERELEVHVFRVDWFEGVPCETEEMRPQWFLFAEIPYDAMWPDDRYWLPLFLAGKKFQGNFHLDRPSSLDYTSKIFNHSLKVMS